jgi:hypothetical protein
MRRIKFTPCRESKYAHDYFHSLKTGQSNTKKIIGQQIKQLNWLILKLNVNKYIYNWII